MVGVTMGQTALKEMQQDQPVLAALVGTLGNFVPNVVTCCSLL